MTSKSSRSTVRNQSVPPERSGPVPRGSRRSIEIVAVAERVFLANGFADTRMLDVAREAGASKETLYRHFHSKEELFAKVVENRAKSLRGWLDTAFDHRCPVVDVLRDVGTKLLEMITDPEMVSFLRMVAAEIPHYPALGQIFYSVGPGQTLSELATFLSASQQYGEFHFDDPSLAAGIFIGAIMSYTHLECLFLGQTAPLSREDITTRVDQVVKMFVKSHRSQTSMPD